MADVTFGHRAGHTPPATMDHPGQWHYVATRLMAHMGAYSPDEMNGLHWPWHQRAALRILATMQDHDIWESPGSPGYQGHAPGLRRRQSQDVLKPPRQAARRNSPERPRGPPRGWGPPLAHTEAPCDRSPRRGARAVPTPRGCKAARRKNAKRQGTLANPVAAAARRLPRRGESSSMRVRTGTTGAPATPTPSEHHLRPIPDAGPRGPTPNGRTSPPFSRQSSASGRQRPTRTPAGQRTEHPARLPPPSQGQQPTHCRGDHTPRTRDQGSLRPTQGLRKERGDSPPRSPHTAEPWRAHRSNRGTTRAAQGRTRK